MDTIVNIYNNENYLEYLKKLSNGYDNNGNQIFMYPNIQNMNITQNKLSLNNLNTTLNGVRLSNFDNSFFQNKSTDIFNYLFYTAKQINEIDIIKQEIDKIKFLLIAPQQESDLQLLNDFLNYYLVVQYYYNLYPTSELKAYYSSLDTVIKMLYDSNYTDKPNILFLKTQYENKLNSDFGQSSTNEKAAVRIRNTSNGTTTSQSIDTNLYTTSTGFATGTLVISLAVTAGITIALLTLMWGL